VSSFLQEITLSLDTLSRPLFDGAAATTRPNRRNIRDAGPPVSDACQAPDPHRVVPTLQGLVPLGQVGHTDQQVVLEMTCLPNLQLHLFMLPSALRFCSELRRHDVEFPAAALQPSVAPPAPLHPGIADSE